MHTTKRMRLYAIHTGHLQPNLPAGRDALPQQSASSQLLSPSAPMPPTLPPIPAASSACWWSPSAAAAEAWLATVMPGDPTDMRMPAPAGPPLLSLVLLPWQVFPGTCRSAPSPGWWQGKRKRKQKQNLRIRLIRHRLCTERRQISLVHWVQCYSALNAYL